MFQYTMCVPVCICCFCYRSTKHLFPAADVGPWYIRLPLMHDYFNMHVNMFACARVYILPLTALYSPT